MAEKVVLVKPSAQAAAKLKVSLAKRNGRSVTAAVRSGGLSQTSNNVLPGA